MGDSYTPIKKWINKTKQRHRRKLTTFGEPKVGRLDVVPAINSRLERVKFEGHVYPENSEGQFGPAIAGPKGNRTTSSGRYIKKAKKRNSTLSKQHSKPSPKAVKFKHVDTSKLFDREVKVVVGETGRKFTVSKMGKRSKKKRRRTKRTKRKKRRTKRRTKRRRNTKKRRKQKGGMATLAEAYGGTNLTSVSNNVSNGIEGMTDNPYGTNDRSSLSNEVGGEHEKQMAENKKQTEANKATKKGQVGGMATLAEAYGSVGGFETVTTGVVSGLAGSILEGNTGKKGVTVPQYKGAPGANENIVKAAKLGEQTKENRKYDTIQKGGRKKITKKKVIHSWDRARLSREKHKKEYCKKYYKGKYGINKKGCKKDSKCTYVDMGSGGEWCYTKKKSRKNHKGGCNCQERF